MTNPFRGEVSLTLDGEEQIMRLSLEALVTLEQAAGSLVSLVERFEAGEAGPRDVSSVLYAGLIGGGWKGAEAELGKSVIAGGYKAAIDAAVALLKRGFGGRDED